MHFPVIGPAQSNTSRQAADGQGSRSGRRPSRQAHPAYPFRVKPLSCTVVGSTPDALALAAYLVTRGAQVRLWTHARQVRRALAAQGGVLVEILDDEARVVPVGLADRWQVGQLLVLVDRREAPCALAATGASDGDRARPHPEWVLALRPVFGSEDWIVANTPGGIARYGCAAAGRWTLVVCGAAPVQGQGLGPAAVVIRKVRTSVPVEVWPDRGAADNLGRLAHYLPMLRALERKPAQPLALHPGCGPG